MSKRVLQGVVVSDTCDKTVIVRVERRVMHRVYKKFMTSSKKYAAHDDKNSYRIDDVVQIEESRPISKRKSWIVISGPAEAAPGRRSARTAVQPASVEAASPDEADPEVAADAVVPSGEVV
jgi:small subunit ribosomal protein S17